MATMLQESAQEWTGCGTIESVKAGCLQRIANATEVMSRRYSELLADRDRYEQRCDREVARRRHAEKRIAALRGWITRLQRKIEAAKTAEGSEG